jgi:hypothetical protein
VNGMLGSGQMKKARQVKDKVKSMLMIFFVIKGICSQKILPERQNNQFHMLL